MFTRGELSLIQTILCDAHHKSKIDMTRIQKDGIPLLERRIDSINNCITKITNLAINYDQDTAIDVTTATSNCKTYAYPKS